MKSSKPKKSSDSLSRINRDSPSPTLFIRVTPSPTPDNQTITRYALTRGDISDFLGRGGESKANSIFEPEVTVAKNILFKDTEIFVHEEMAYTRGIRMFEDEPFCIFAVTIPMHQTIEDLANLIVMDHADYIKGFSNKSSYENGNIVHLKSDSSPEDSKKSTLD